MPRLAHGLHLLAVQRFQRQSRGVIQHQTDRVDRLAVGEPAGRQWAADWVYVPDLGINGHWQPTRSGLVREWHVNLNGQSVVCRLDDHGRVGLRGRDIPCADWVRQRIEGCYDLDDIRVLNLFGGNGYVSACALQAGASVIHVDASATMLSLARANAGDSNIEYVQENVMEHSWEVATIAHE